MGVIYQDDFNRASIDDKWHGNVYPTLSDISITSKYGESSCVQFSGINNSGSLFFKNNTKLWNFQKMS